MLWAGLCGEQVPQSFSNTCMARSSPILQEMILTVLRKLYKAMLFIQVPHIWSEISLSGCDYSLPT